MLKKFLIISIVAITSLLSLQVLWLTMVIKHEKINYELKCKELVDIAVKKELKHRRARLEKVDTNKNTLFTSNFVSKKDAKGRKPNKYSVYQKDMQGDSDFLGLTVDHFLQVYEKDHGRTFSISVFSNALSKDLDSLGMGTNYTLNYSDFDTQKQFNQKGKNICFNRSFSIVTYLTVTKNMKINAVIYYPISVYKGKFLSIIAFSVLLLIVIVYLLIYQMHILSEQVTLAKIKENLTRFFTHELRSPLQSALSGVEMLEDAAKKGNLELVERYGVVSKDKLMYINGFVERMLDVNKLKSRRVNLNKLRFNLLGVVNKLADEYSNCVRKEVNLQIDSSCNIEIFGDFEHIYNVLSNLVENAVKYSGDSVCIKITAKTGNKHTTVIVEDNGIGIPEVDQKMIFNQFYRVNSPFHTAKSKGFGLGLNYVKWVAQAHSGRVFVESTEGVGSKFSFTISNKWKRKF